jgi:hypothetical protein
MSGFYTSAATYMTSSLTYQSYIFWTLIFLLIGVIGIFLYGIYSTYLLVKVRALLTELRDAQQHLS